MNYSTAVMLFNENIRAVKTSYEFDSLNRPTGFKVFKTLDPEIAVGDLVVIPTTTRHKATVVRVEEVDVEVDFDSKDQLDWIISKVDVAAHVTVLEQEGNWIAAIKESEKRKKRETIKENMSAMLKEQGVEIPTFSSTLAIAN